MNEKRDEIRMISDLANHFVAESLGVMVEKMKDKFGDGRFDDEFKYAFEKIMHHAFVVGMKTGMEYTRELKETNKDKH